MTGKDAWKLLAHAEAADVLLPHVGKSPCVSACATENPHGRVPLMDATAHIARELAEARKALHDAESAARTMDEATLATLRQSLPAEAFAAAQANADNIAATIPALRGRVTELEDLACPRCDGTGTYFGPTGDPRKRRQLIPSRRPECSACGGTGTRR